MREHWLTIPFTAICPLVALAIFLAKTNGWTNGALGCVILGLIGIAAAVSSLMAPAGIGSTPRRMPGRRRR
jgi:hypothetical protein